MYNQFQPNPNFDMQAIYRAQIAGLVLSPASRTEEGSIRLRTSPRNLYLYLVLFFFLLMSPLSYLLLFEGVPLAFTILTFAPAAVLLVLLVITLCRQKTILIDEHAVTVRPLLWRKRVYTYDRVTAMSCFPQGNASGRYHGTIPLQNVMVLTFDDKKSIKLPVVMPGYADLFRILDANTNFESEISKVVQYYFRLGIDIRNKCTIQPDVFPGMGGTNGSGMNGPSGGAGGSDPNNPFEGF